MEVTERLPGSDFMCEDALDDSMNQSPVEGGVRDRVLKLVARDC